MNITLIRHTKVATKKGICYGQSDVKLALSFRDEKNAILNKIMPAEYNIVYSSPLNRCKKLAKALFPNKEIIYDERLMELNFGIWEGLHWDDISTSEEAKVFFEDYINTSCPGGESYQDLINRISDFYGEIIPKHAEEQMAIVCHGGTIRAFLCAVEGISAKEAFERKVEYGEVIKIKKQKLKE